MEPRGVHTTQCLFQAQGRGKARWWCVYETLAKRSRKPIF